MWCLAINNFLPSNYCIELSKEKEQNFQFWRLRHVKDRVQLFCGRPLSHHKQEAGCIYVNNAGPWNAIMHLDLHGTEGPAYACTGPYNIAQSCTYLFRLKRGV